MEPEIRHITDKIRNELLRHYGSAPELSYSRDPGMINLYYIFSTSDSEQDVSDPILKHALDYFSDGVRFHQNNSNPRREFVTVKGARIPKYFLTVDQTRVAWYQGSLLYHSSKKEKLNFLLTSLVVLAVIVYLKLYAPEFNIWNKT